jgi:peptide/nickel transport system ATP-binding protein
VSPAPAILSVRDLRVEIPTPRGAVRAVDGVSLEVPRGGALGLVGESGCGKTMTLRAILGLLPGRARITGGEVVFDGHALSPRSLGRLRGDSIGMVFQEPMTALNPVFTVGDQIAEVVRVHDTVTRKAAWQRAVEMLTLMGIPAPEERAKAYPHQLSGGMRQRVMIAMALVMHPALVIADEPTTALDVTIQAQILKLMVELNGRVGAAIMLITHDLGVIAETAHRVVVMYAGRKVEEADVDGLFERPIHPYTRGLMVSIPRGRQGVRSRRLSEIPGMVPSLRESTPGQAPFSGCAFAPRCGFAKPRCHEQVPPLLPYGESGKHLAACWEIEQVLAS